MLEEQALRRAEIKAAQDAVAADIKARQGVIDAQGLKKEINQSAKDLMAHVRDFDLPPAAYASAADIAADIAATRLGAAQRGDDPYALRDLPLDARTAAHLFAKGDPESWKKLLHMSRGTMGVIDKAKFLNNLDAVMVGSKHRIPSDAQWREEFYRTAMGVK